jgi:hypothetical protein
MIIFSDAMVDIESKIQNASLESIQRQFTYSELLDDTQVAVKMLSPSSVQGFQQFQSEACKNFKLISIYMAGLMHGYLKIKLIICNYRLNFL